MKCLRRTNSATLCVVRQNCQKERLLIEMLTQNKFSNLMRCEAKLGKVEAINWNAYAEQVQQLVALWGKIGKKRGYWLKCLRRTSSATWCVVRQNCEVEAINWIFTQNNFSNLMRCEAKLAKREAVELRCLRRTSSATWCDVRQNWQK